MSLPLVTRFGADPLLDLEVANKRYVDNSSGGTNSSVMGHSSSSNVANGQNSAYFQINSWHATESARQFVMVQAGVLSLFIIDVDVNNNTVDGAIMRTRTNATNANMLVEIDQDTGTFQDITNTDTVALADFVGYRYTQGNGTILIHSESSVFTPT